jgi:trigger factor
MADEREEESGAVAVEGAEDAKERLNLDVKIDKTGACQRHITVTIPREDIDKYYDAAYSDLMGKASIPGFRSGRAPRKLVESRFKKEITDQIKGSLLMDSMTQATDDNALAAISEPDIDPVGINVPDEGPMVYEFNLEVRPEFDVPNWKGLKIERPVREFNDADVDQQIKSLLERQGRLVPHDGAAEAGDYISTKLTFKDGDREISSSPEEVIRIRKVLSFRDGKIEAFDKLMAGVKAGETRVGKAKLTEDAPNESLRGKAIEAVFEVLEVKRLETPALDDEFLKAVGDFDSEAELREAVKKNLARQLEFHQQRRAREQVLGALTVHADWELPPDLLRRQWGRELDRMVLELRRSGFSDEQILASRSATARLLKEHFILERIAEDEKIEDLSEDYDKEIALIAMQSGESPRRVRAQLQKRGLMDTLRNQIIERKVIDMVLKEATFTDAPYKTDSEDAEALDQAAGGGEDDGDIPEAKYTAGPASTLPDADKARE